MVSRPTACSIRRYGEILHFAVSHPAQRRGRISSSGGGLTLTLTLTLGYSVWQGRGDGPEAGTSGASEAARASCRLGSSGVLPPPREIFKKFRNFKCHIVRFSASYAASADIMKIFVTAQFTLVQSAVLRLHVVHLSVRLSVTLVDCDHIG